MSPALESEPRSPRERMGSGKAVKEGDFFPTDFITGPKVPQNLEPKRGGWIIITTTLVSVTSWLAC